MVETGKRGVEDLGGWGRGRGRYERRVAVGEEMEVVTDYAAPLLDYASARVGRLLREYGKDEDGGGDGGRKKKMSPVEVDLVEGLKHLIRSTSSHIVAALKSDAVVKATTEFGGAVIEVENWVAKCKLGGLRTSE